MQPKQFLVKLLEEALMKQCKVCRNYILLNNNDLENDNNIWICPDCYDQKIKAFSEFKNERDKLEQFISSNMQQFISKSELDVFTDTLRLIMRFYYKFDELILYIWGLNSILWHKNDSHTVIHINYEKHGDSLYLKSYRLVDSLQD